MAQKVRKAVIAAAGFGTRFLPATKAMPKEMLPLVDKPIIQYAVEELVSAGIEDIAIVTGWHKRNIEDHFDYPFELEKRLEEAGKHDKIEEVRRIAEMANFHYIRQKGPYGNGVPIWNARSFIGDEPFLYLWADDFIDATPTRSQQLVAAYEQFGGSAILSSIRLSRDVDYKRYGYAIGKEVRPGLLKADKTIEKPGPGVIDSDYAIVSGFLFGPEMVPAISEALQRRAASGSANELYYVEGLNILLEQLKDVYALEIKGGKYYDCGDKLEYLKTVVEFGLRHDDLRDDLKEYLRGLSL
ncbi:MAG: NTP transferase domain-containing protein [Candidatus Doudnabacteria bacterium]|nr:NTP transferase domain-containing protein [Candidatus Doudnabacteria bacterium]